MKLHNQYVAPTTTNVKHLTSTFENGSTIQFATGIRSEDLAAIPAGSDLHSQR